MIIKALTLWQPWASLIAFGEKKYETRSWSTNYRGLMAIHAAKRPTQSWEIDNRIDQLLLFHKTMAHHLPLGEIVCICNLVDVVPTAEIKARARQNPRGWETELFCGDYGPGRYAWKLEMVLQPTLFPARGSQGLWDWEVPESVADELTRYVIRKRERHAGRP